LAGHGGIQGGFQVRQFSLVTEENPNGSVLIGPRLTLPKVDWIDSIPG